MPDQHWSGYDRNAPKRATNLSVNADLLRRARELGVNLSATLETELARVVGEAERQALIREMDRTAEVWNDFRQAHGSAIDEFRDL